MVRPNANAIASITSPDRDVVPLYHRVYVILLQKISDGSYAFGESMPSEDDLADAFGVSRVTIRKAMDRLEREGRVLRQRGRGTFPQPPVLQAGGNQLLSNQISLARKTRVAVIDHAMARLPDQLAAVFGQPAGANLLRIERVRRDDRSPISHTVCWVAADLAPLLPRSTINSLPISAILSAAGVRLQRFQERITAVLADSDLARHLEIDVGAALVAMTRQITDDTGRVVELLQAVYRTDRYEYRVEYGAADQQAGAPWKAMITDSGA